jgi:hypothetical protein
MCVLGVLANILAIRFNPFGSAGLFNASFDDVRQLGEASWQQGLYLIHIWTILPLGVAGIAISLALLRRGQVALKALDVFLVVKWLVFMGPFIALLDFYNDLQAGWDVSPSLRGSPGHGTPEIALFMMLLYLVANLPLIGACAYWWRPTIRRYAIG